MTYVVSDLHGCFEKFKKLLREIRFNDNDVMYVIGDIVDQGDESMELLCDLSMRFNVIPILGDHDLRALKLLGELDKMLRDGVTPDAEVLGEMTEWIRDGGQKTMEGFKALDDDMKEGVLDGMIFECNAEMGLGMQSELWLRDWIKKNKYTEIPD